MTKVLEVTRTHIANKAGRARKNGDLEIWAKDMEDGSKPSAFSIAQSETKNDRELVGPRTHRQTKTFSRPLE